MKDFPRFSESIIKLNLTQPQMKLLLLAVSTLADSLESTLTSEEVKALITKAQSHFTFELPSQYSIDQKSFSNDMHLLVDSLSDPYYLVKSELQDLVNRELHQYYIENFDPEILNIPEGETLKVADYV